MRVEPFSTHELYSAQADQVRLNWNDAEDGFGDDRGAVAIGSKGGVIIQGDGFEVDIHKNAAGEIGEGSVIDVHRGTKVESVSISGTWNARVDLPHGATLQIQRGEDNEPAWTAIVDMPEVKGSLSNFFQSANAEYARVLMGRDGVTVRQTTHRDTDVGGPHLTRLLDTRLTPDVKQSTPPEWKLTNVLDNLYLHQKMVDGDGRISDKCTLNGPVEDLNQCPVVREPLHFTKSR